MWRSLPYAADSVNTLPSDSHIGTGIAYRDPSMRFDLFSSNRLYDALVEAGYPEKDLNRRTLRDWVRKDSPPEALRQFAAEHLMGTAKEPPEPVWVERLLAGVMALESDAEITDAELALAEAKAIAYLTVARQRRPRQGGGGGGGASNA